MIAIFRVCGRELREEKIIDIVISSYGQIEAEKLIELTHNEDPWISVEKNDVIDFEKIKKYFQKVYES